MYSSLAISAALAGSGLLQGLPVDKIPAPTTPAGMVLIQESTFAMGRDASHADEAPVHEITLSPYYIDAHEVTNREFKAFVDATGHVTQAEKDGYCWSYVAGKTDFEALDGADWRHPQGPDSTIDDRMDHPVVGVSWEDAAAYAAWAGKRLPTEAEWEFAARGGAEGHFSAAPAQEGAHADHDAGVARITANIWQGVWPDKNLLTDNHYYTAPVGSYPANALGVHDAVGNVWEWCADWYAADYYTNSPAVDPQGPASGENRVARGGSWFCSANYCGAYSTHYRGASPPTHAFNNVGFRCAKSVDPTDGATSEVVSGDAGEDK